jgi:tetratricopeptide (TPR) repeat protein
MFIALVIFGTVGLVWYMNFADGTRQDPITGDAYLEVRDRDYFWTPGFIAFALAIGLGLASVGLKLVEWIKEKGLPRAAAVIPAAVAAMAFAFPVFGAVSNFSANQRINNYLPYDYAYNLLSSCEKDAVLFTNGDNDTFPLWALQEAYGFRRDVRIVNLSLINTSWYIAQMKKLYGVPIGLTDAEIAAIRPDFDQSTGRISRRVQDKVIDNILETNRWKTPVHFSVTCSPEARMYRGRSLDPYLIMEGMVYRVVPEGAQALRINVPSMLKQYTETYRYRGVSDPKVRKDENDLRIIQNYVFAFVYYIADTLRKAGDWQTAEKAIRKGIELAPQESFGYHYLTQMLVDQGKLGEVESLITHTPLSETLKDSLRFYVGAAYYRKGEVKKAEAVYVASYQRDRQNGFRDLFSFYYEIKDYRQCVKLAEEWLAAYPNDPRAGELRNLLAQIQTLIRADSAAKGVPGS